MELSVKNQNYKNIIQPVFKDIDRRKNPALLVIKLYRSTECVHVLVIQHCPIRTLVYLIQFYRLSLVVI